jgi:hypothetical protein
MNLFKLKKNKTTNGGFEKNLVYSNAREQEKRYNISQKGS